MNYDHYLVRLTLGDMRLSLGDGDGEEVGDGQNWAFFTLEMLVSTPTGVTFPITVTFFVSKSMLNDVTPSILDICFLSFPSHPLQ